MPHAFFASADPLDALFRNMGTMIPLLLGLGAWLIATWKKLQQKQSTGSPPASDEAERTRRVQEEVRRKIAERRGRQSEEDEPARAPVPGAARSAMGEGWRGFVERQRTEIPSLDSFGGPNRRPVKAAPVPAPPIVADRDDPDVLERQRWLNEQASVRQAASQRSAASVAQAALSTPVPVVSPWLVELREPATVRRAIVLREILGPPVALR